MSEFSQTAGSASGAAGGTPSESDLPRMQGLDENTDDPSDPSAAGAGASDEVNQTVDDPALGEDDESASDPMHDIAGTSGG
jgi:hypothetical protein